MNGPFTGVSRRCSPPPGCARRVNFSRYHKYALGQDVRDGARRVLKLVVRANARRDKTPVLLELREELDNPARFGGAWDVVVACHEDHDRIGQLAHETIELQERVQNRLVRRPYAMKNVSRHDDDIRPERDDAVDGRAKSRRDVRFPLIDAAGSEPLVLSVA